MATYADRLAAVETLMTAGKGLTAYTEPVRDVITVKDPHGVIGGVVTDPLEIWKEYAGVTALAAYGL